MKPISYVNFNERGLQPIADELKEKHGQNVVAIKADNMAKREDGFAVKTATFALESGQKLVIKIKASGSIFQARLNGKVVPVKNADDLQDPRNLAKAIEEMASYIKRNEPAYLKQRRNQVVRKKERSSSATVSTAKRLEELRASQEELKSAVEGAQADLVEAKGQLESKQQELSALQAELDQETKRYETLSAELAELKEAA